MNFEFSILNPRRDGFTLLEMIIVLSLVTLIIGLSAVFFAGAMSSNRIYSSARDLSSTLLHARTLSRMSGESRAVAIDLDAKRFGIEGRGYKSIPEDIGIKAVDPVDGEIETGLYRIVFRVAGSVPAGVIVLWNKKREVKIELDPIVGTVVIK